MKLLKVFAVLLAAVPALAQTPEIDAVLDKAGDYVVAYERTFVGVVAEETYRSGGSRRRRHRSARLRDRSARPAARPEIRHAPGSRAGRRSLDPVPRRLEVDGKPVRDRAERLAKLFLQPSASTQQQVDDIAAASARYNIGGVNRNINLPVLALTVLEPQNRPWFSFKVRRRRATRSTSSSARSAAAR